MFSDTGVGRWFRYLPDPFELAGAVGLLVPPARPAAPGLVNLVIDAALTRLFVLGRR
jgi:hypothetical protein